MSSANHPPCGLYRTTRPLDGVPAGRLVYFHNHGNPGAGIYLPQSWASNRARWQQNGFTVPDAEWSQSLAPLAPEGLYRVAERFYCCEKRCRAYEPNQLVQLGYNGEAEPLMFVPEWTNGGLGIPERGNKLDASALSKLTLLVVAEGQASQQQPAGGLLH
ncbi:MAG: hypothetical protein JNK82_38130 [Myxococcaceae bacterium]|nr:hypothetical protein [Myxococcaceae bacterium]